MDDLYKRMYLTLADRVTLAADKLVMYVTKGIYDLENMERVAYMLQSALEAAEEVYLAQGENTAEEPPLLAQGM